MVQKLLQDKILNISGIIYSRLSSTRLKNKALIRVKGKYLIEHVIEEAKKISSLNKIILATTKKKEDLIFKQIAKKKKIKFFRGSELNLIKRTTDCCNKFKINYFLRICGDRPYFDHKKINIIIKKLKRKKLTFDFVTSNLNNKADEGLTIEIINVKFLKRINKLGLSSFDKEHLTRKMYNLQNSKNFIFKNIKLPKYYFFNLKHSIDTSEDLERFKFVITNVKKNDGIKKYINLNLEWKKNNEF